jgi:hypothetical protein
LPPAIGSLKEGDLLISSAEVFSLQRVALLRRLKPNKINRLRYTGTSSVGTQLQ